MKLKPLLTFCIAVLILSNFSCTAYKNIPYFQDLRRDSIITEDMTNITPLTIQPGDLLGVHVTSLNADASAIFNYNLERPSGNSNLDKGEENAVIGYLVDQSGNIRLPMIGDVKVQGLTTTEISKLIESKLDGTVLKQPRVNTRIQNFRISLIGDIREPKQIAVWNERITVLDALSNAGDLTVTGIRQITLIRELDGKRMYIPLDLTSKNLFKSPYYYLKNNDIIYVQPNRARAQDDGTTFQRASIVVSVLSIIAILLTR